MGKISLSQIIDFDGLIEKYNNKPSGVKKRLKFRFNTDWATGDTGTYHSYKQMYFDDEELMSNWMNSTYRGDVKKNNRRQMVEDIVFHFIEIEPHKWLFVGAVNVLKDRGHQFDDSLEPDIYKDTWTCQVEPIKELDAFKDVLIVEFTNKPQNYFYVNRDILDDVAIDQILPVPYKERQFQFPGFNNVSMGYKNLNHVIDGKEWKNALSGVYGVYVITDTKNGKLYVGSAYGDEGVYGRWKTYLKDGYDKDEESSNDQYPNKGLRELVKAEGIGYIKEHFQYSLLEMFPKTELGKKQALERESYWKEVFASRENGYNRN